MFSVTVIIETPRQTAGKYVLDPANHIYRLKKILPLGMHFPYDFGLIENTHAQDGDRYQYGISFTKRRYELPGT